MNKTVQVNTAKKSFAVHLATVACTALILSCILIVGGRFAVWAGEQLNVPYKWIVFGLAGIVCLVADHLYTNRK